MTIDNADYVQVLYPKQVVDYLADAQKGVPENSRVVCFARKPKPDDYPAEWIKEYWVEWGWWDDDVCVWFGWNFLKIGKIV